MALPTVVLASASPRRRRLLEQLGLPVVVHPSGIDETLNGLSPDQFALELSRRKAEAIAAGLDEGYVMAADTLGTIDGEILGKPFGDQDAMRMLWKLSDRTHEVYTGLTVLHVRAGRIEARAADITRTRVTFRPLTLGDIRAYIETHEHEGKAGGYAIQGAGRGLVSTVDGSYTNVVGLPIGTAVRLLDQIGYPVPAVDTDSLDVDPEAREA